MAVWKLKGYHGLGSALSFSCERDMRTEGNSLTIFFEEYYQTYRPPNDSIKFTEFLDMLGRVHDSYFRSSPSWLEIKYKEWLLDLDQLRQYFPQLKEEYWLTGIISLYPDFKLNAFYTQGEFRTSPTIFLYLTPYIIEEVKVNFEVPNVISDSLRKFQVDYPLPDKVGFIMMDFTDSRLHGKIVKAIKNTLTPFGLTAIRADDEQYHTDLFPNVLTYMYGCGFGIAVFERLMKEEHNPNVALEVGYMMALEKQICYLKDKTLKALPSDLIGKFYEDFDTQSPATTIPKPLKKWLKNKELLTTTQINPPSKKQ